MSRLRQTAIIVAMVLVLIVALLAALGIEARR